MLAGWSVFFLAYLGNRSKSDPCSYKLFCLESHILSFPKVLQISPESPCRYGSEKHNYIYLIYKVLVYVQTSQPTTCFGLFQLGHLQVGHKGQRNYTIMQILSLKSGGTRSRLQNLGHVCRLVILKYMHCCQ